MRTALLVSSLLIGLNPAWGRPGESPPARARNVVVVTLDGFRPEEFFGGADRFLIDRQAGGVRDVPGLEARFWRDDPEERRRALLPFLWGTVAREGQIFGDRSKGAPVTLTNGLKFSYPGYNELFCGFGDPRIASNDKIPNPNRSVFEFLDGRPSFEDRVAAFCTWDVFPSILRADRNNLEVLAGWTPIDDEPPTDRQRSVNRMVDRLPHYWPSNAFDAISIEAALEHLARHTPRVLYVGLGETDEWAHERRYDRYLDAAHRSDRFLEELWTTLQQMPEYRDRTALVVTTDHGRGTTGADWPDHGRDVPGAEALWIAVMGPDTPALGVREGVPTTQSQVAATIAALVGEDFRADSPKAAPPLPVLNPTPEPDPR